MSKSQAVKCCLNTSSFVLISRSHKNRFIRSRNEKVSEFKNDKVKKIDCYFLVPVQSMFTLDLLRTKGESYGLVSNSLTGQFCHPAPSAMQVMLCFIASFVLSPLLVQAGT